MPLVAAPRGSGLTALSVPWAPCQRGAGRGNGPPEIQALQGVLYTPVRQTPLLPCPRGDSGRGRDWPRPPGEEAMDTLPLGQEVSVMTPARLPAETSGPLTQRGCPRQSAGSAVEPGSWPCTDGPAGVTCGPTGKTTRPVTLSPSGRSLGNVLNGTTG